MKSVAGLMMIWFTVWLGLSWITWLVAPLNWVSDSVFRVTIIREENISNLNKHKNPKESNDRQSKCISGEPVNKHHAESLVHENLLRKVQEAKNPLYSDLISECLVQNYKSLPAKKRQNRRNSHKISEVKIVSFFNQTGSSHTRTLWWIARRNIDS